MLAETRPARVDRLATRAPAKVNLTLNVLGRLADGYHELSSLVAFAGTGDDLFLTPGPDLDLVVEGPRAGATGPIEGNLIIKASRALMERRPHLRAGVFRLVKRLPAAAGLGGGSSDAAAALRLLARLNGLNLDDPAIGAAARASGADVPVCLVPRMRVMRGIGDVLGRALPATRFFAVLINPAIPVETASVFRGLDLAPGERHRSPTALFEEDDPGEPLARIAASGNDLEVPAISLAPVITDALEALRRMAGCNLARMSGSGATVFGLFGGCAQAASAARAIGRERPGWWIKATILR